MSEREHEGDIKELAEVLDVVGGKVPKLISDIIDSLMNKQNAEEFAKQVAGFYKNLKDSGMSEENAAELTKKFMESRDVISALKDVLAESGFTKGRSFRFSKEENKEKEDEK